MRLVPLGPVGHEHLAVLVDEDTYVDVSDVSERAFQLECGGQRQPVGAA